MKIKFSFFLLLIIMMALNIIFVTKALALTTDWYDVSSRTAKQGVISRGKGEETNVTTSDNGKIYVAFQDGYHNKRVHVKGFDGVNWFDLSDTQNPFGLVSEKSGGNPILETNQDEVYVTFTDYNNWMKAKVKKWNGVSWSDLSDNNHPDGYISQQTGTEPTLAFDKTKNNLYVAFGDQAGDNRIHIMRFNNEQGWSDVGTGLVSDGAAAEATIVASSTDNSMFLCYEDTTNGNRIRVKKWDGSTWSNVSDDNFSDGLIGLNAGYKPSLAIDSRNHLYLSYVQLKESGHSIIYHWDGSSWQMLGDGSISSFNTTEPFLAVDNRDFVHIAFSEKKKSKKYGNIWRVRTRLWNGSTWIDTRNKKDIYLTSKNGKGDPSLAAQGNDMILSFTSINADKKAKVKKLLVNL